MTIIELLARLGLAPMKLLSKQARKPTRFLGKRIARAMNKGNTPLYRFVIPLLDLQPGCRILEIGFGNGKMFSEVFSACKNIHITGLDFSPTMVDEARLYNVDALQSGILDLHHGSSDQMPFEDNTFDRVFCINVAYFWNPPQDHLKEVRRVLKPGGIFCPVLRDRKSLEGVPFTKHGFLIRSENEWLDDFRAGNFYPQSIGYLNEPARQLGRKTIEMKSFCPVLEKRSSV